MSKYEWNVDDGGASRIPDINDEMGWSTRTWRLATATIPSRVRLLSLEQAFTTLTARVRCAQEGPTLIIETGFGYPAWQHRSISITQDVLFAVHYGIAPITTLQDLPIERWKLFSPQTLCEIAELASYAEHAITCVPFDHGSRIDGAWLRRWELEWSYPLDSQKVQSLTLGEGTTGVRLTQPSQTRIEMQLTTTSFFSHLAGIRATQKVFGAIYAALGQAETINGVPAEDWLWYSPSAEPRKGSAGGVLLHP